MMDFGSNPPEWLYKLVIRLLSFGTPGVYEFLLIVEEGGKRRLVAKNANQPHRLEDLSSKEKEKSK